MPFIGAEVSSPFQKRPAYKYIRKSDHLPTYDQIPDIPMRRIVAKVKLFNPTGIGTWYIAAYDPGDHIAWGLADLHEREIGSFSMDELVAFRGRFGLPIERDLHWSPKDLATLQAGGGRYRARRTNTKPPRYLVIVDGTPTSRWDDRAGAVRVAGAASLAGMHGHRAVVKDMHTGRVVEFFDNAIGAARTRRRATRRGAVQHRPAWSGHDRAR